MTSLQRLAGMNCHVHIFARHGGPYHCFNTSIGPDGTALSTEPSKTGTRREQFLEGFDSQRLKGKGPSSVATDARCGNQSLGLVATLGDLSAARRL
jgi:hypothetical protein